jgi:hypothetical protein
MPGVKIVIPAYKKTFSEYEKLSLVQCCKILGKYLFSLVCPDNLDVSNYVQVFEEYNVKYDVNRFSDKYSGTFEEYNELLLSKSFYERFIDNEFILIYQLDAFVFRDELEYWCEQAFDYMGAPWFEGYNFSDANSRLLDIAGNGGFSLRKIPGFLRLLNNRKFAEYKPEQHHEDHFYSTFGPKIDAGFRIAPPEVAMYFSFECLPDKLFRMTGEKLPFGCHAWGKYDPDFWQQYITRDSRNFSLEFSLMKSELESAKNIIAAAQSQLDSTLSQLDSAKSAIHKLQAQLKKVEAERAAGPQIIERLNTKI